MAPALQTSQALIEAALLTYMPAQLERLQQLKKKQADNKTWMYVSFVVAVAFALLAFVSPYFLFLCLLIVPGISGYLSAKAAFAKELANPKQRIRSVTVGNLPIDVLTTGKKTYVFELAGLLSKSSVLFPSEKPAEKLRELLITHNQIVDDLPVVLPPSNRQYISGGDVANQPLFAEERQLHNVQSNAFQVLEHLETVTEQVPLMKLNPVQLKELLDITQTGGSLWAKVPEFKTGSASSREAVHTIVNRLEGELKSSGDAGAQVYDAKRFLKEYRGQIEEDLTALALAREHSLKQLIPRYTQGINRLPLIASYVAYCPKCNAKAIEFLLTGEYDPKTGYVEPFDANGKMRHEPGDDCWICLSCGSRTKHPLFIHRLLDEIILPVMESRLQDNRKERVHYYTEAEEKKRRARDAASQRIESVTTSYQSISHRINSIVREISSQVGGAQAALAFLNEQLVMFEGKARERLQQINQAFSRQLSDIQQYQDQALRSFAGDVASIEKASQIAFQDIKYQARMEEQARLKIQREMVSRLASIESHTADTARNTAQVADNTASIATNTKRMMLDTRVMCKMAGGHEGFVSNYDKQAFIEDFSLTD